MLLLAGQRVSELERQPRAGGGIDLVAQQLAHPRRARGLARRDLGPRELQPQAGVRRALGQRVAQQRGGDVRRAASAGVRRGTSQHARRPRVSRGLGGEELSGDDPDVGAAGVEHAGGAQMQARALRCGDAGKGGDAQEGVTPRERHGVGQRRRGRELARRGRSILLLQARQGAGVAQPGRVTEDRGCAGQAPRRLGDRCQAQRDGAGHRLRRKPSDLSQRRRVVSRRGRGERTRELDDQQRRAARGAQARVAQLRSRLAAQPLAQHEPHGVRAERHRPHAPHRRPVEQPGDELTCLAAANADDEREGKRLGTPGEVEQEAHRGGVRPVRVIDQQRPRSALRERSRECVQAVHHSPGLVSAAGLPRRSPSTRAPAAPAPSSAPSKSASAGSSRPRTTP